MSKPAKFISEGGSSTRPPLFEGNDYYYWKDKMELFLRSQDNYMWSVVENGEYTPLAKDSITPKPQAEWTTTEADRVLLNTKAQLFIKSALCREEYDRIMQCKNAKEMWETLKTHHEGTSRVKETRIDIGVRKFELFEMKEDESIDQMYGRFTIIINELNSLGKTYTTHERVRKVLRCLPKEWRHIVTAITESKTLSEVKMEDLIGSLKAHEAILQEDKSPKKKMIALDSQTKECLQQKEILFSKDLLDEDNEEEFALLSRRIQRLMMRRNQMRRTFPNKRNSAKSEVDMSKIQCYECNQFGHYKSDCPKLKKPFAKKSMMATWDELDELPEEEEEQEANVCLMTRSETHEVNAETCSSCQKTEHLFDNLFYDSLSLNKKYDQLQEEVTKISKEKDEYKTENETLKEIIKNMEIAHNRKLEELRENQKEQIKPNIQIENRILKENISKLENDINKFVKSTKTFENILGSQKCSSSKTGLGFENYNNQKLYKKLFVPNKPIYKCSYCHKEGHLEPFCFRKSRQQNYHRKYLLERSQNNLKKSTHKQTYRNSSYQHKKSHYNTNHQGPRKIWVPKNMLKINAGMSSHSQEEAMVLGQWLLQTYDWR
ncbi:uncharacterized protein LOC123886125 [Trifolium pratense]|uniref:uncharacterized protein LOC123886125 n=1 Tax=Trifolium pratense TaxID=57577 RepID=UPI001E697CA1|nr:uncharacterized protein LOC123886125 [Trifolium pratense]